MSCRSSGTCSTDAAVSPALQRRRRRLQFAFFTLFLVAPALNLFRFDLQAVQLWLLGQRWSLGIDAFRAGEMSANALAGALVLRAFVPAILVVVGFLTIAYKFGRLYCGWLCPHFSVVELLNDVMHRASGRFSLWDKRSEPASANTFVAHSPRDTSSGRARRLWWPVFALLALGLAFLWAITLLTYLLPPVQVWGHLVTGTLTAGESRFLVAATTVFCAEFVLARHLFCRFGCAVGYFQSLAWMANPKAMVVSFARDRAQDCRTCTTIAAPQGNACDTGCPMRLRPRSVKRMMFSCTQCAKCLTACTEARASDPQGVLLEWHVGADALRETLRTHIGSAAGLRRKETA